MYGTGWNAESESRFTIFAPRFMYGSVSSVIATSALQFRSIIRRESSSGIWS